MKQTNKQKNKQYAGNLKKKKENTETEAEVDVMHS